MKKEHFNLNMNCLEARLLLNILNRRIDEVDKELDGLEVICYSNKLSMLCYEKAFIKEMLYKIKLVG